jgi:hypothetical protein
LKNIILLLFLSVSFSSTSRANLYTESLYKPGIKVFAGYTHFDSTSKLLHFNHLFSNSIKVHSDFTIDQKPDFLFGIGYEQNLENHIYINYGNLAVGNLLSHTINLNLSTGIGVNIELGKLKTVVLRPGFSLFYSVLNFNFPSNLDTTLIHYRYHGKKYSGYSRLFYQNNTIGIVPNLNVLFRRARMSYFVNVGYQQILWSNERIEFINRKGPSSSFLLKGSDAIKDDHQEIYKNLIDLSKFNLQGGIVINI